MQILLHSVPLHSIPTLTNLPEAILESSRLGNGPCCSFGRGMRNSAPSNNHSNADVLDLLEQCEVRLELLFNRQFRNWKSLWANHAL
jgi:hypothetical protein